VLIVAVAACDGASDRAVVSVVDAPLLEVVPGARIALVETHGVETNRLGSGCFDVLAADPAGPTTSVTLAVGPTDAAAIAALAPDARVRVAICRSEATPLGRSRPSDALWEVAIPAAIPADLAQGLRPGDRLGLGSEPRAILGAAWTISAPGYVTAPPEGAVFLLGDQEEGRFGVTLFPAPGEPTRDHLATLIPEGMQLVAVPLPPEAARIGAFVNTADQVDATVVLDGHATVLLRAVPLLALGQGTLAAILEPERAERWVQAVFSAPLTLALRLEGGARGLALPIAAGGRLAVGDPIVVRTASGETLLRGELLALAADSGGEALGLVGTSDEGVLAVAAAGPDVRIVAAGPP
jgi:hypothetical protein